MNIISLSDRRKSQRSDEMARLCSRLRWFLDADDRDNNLTKEMSRTATALDVVVTEHEREIGKNILCTRRMTFGFIDPAVSEKVGAQEFNKLAISKRADTELAGSIGGRFALSGGVLR